MKPMAFKKGSWGLASARPSFLSARTKRQSKSDRFVLFITKLAKRRKLVFAESRCPSRHEQIVDVVTPAGGGYFYTSRACGGCFPLAKAVQHPDFKHGCTLIKSTVLFTFVPIQTGDIVEHTPLRELYLEKRASAGHVTDINF